MAAMKQFPTPEEIISIGARGVLVHWNTSKDMTQSLY